MSISFHHSNTKLKVTTTTTTKTYLAHRDRHGQLGGHFVVAEWHHVRSLGVGTRGMASLKLKLTFRSLFIVFISSRRSLVQGARLQRGRPVREQVLAVQVVAGRQVAELVAERPAAGDWQLRSESAPAQSHHLQGDHGVRASAQDLLAPSHHLQRDRRQRYAQTRRLVDHCRLDAQRVGGLLLCLVVAHVRLQREQPSGLHLQLAKQM